MRARGLLVAVLCAVFGGLGLTAGSAFAAAPETPEGVEANPVAMSTATLHGVLNPQAPGEAGSYEFLYRQSASECQGGEATGGSALGDQAEAVSVAVSGLLPNRQYTFCVLARNEAGETTLSQSVTFKTQLTGPVLGEESASNVAASSATLEARVNPEGSDTTYRFEYGTSTMYGESIPSPDGDAGPGTSTVGVLAHPQDLKPHTVYHYRVLVTNAVETVTGPDQKFTTQSAGGELTLPDGRQWEMVSPPAKDGADINPVWLVEAAENGDAVTYFANAPTEANPLGNPVGTQVLSTRVAGGWSSRDIALPQTEPDGNGVGGDEYAFFSSDLSRAVVEPFSRNVLLPPATFEPTVHSNVYIRDNVGGSGYTPLITAADVLPGTEKYGAPAGFVGATPDLSHVVLSSELPLTSPPPVIRYPGESGLYEWAGGSLQAVSVLPASEGGEPVVGELGEGSYHSLARGAVSNDGSRIVWTGGPEGHLYMRDVAKEETVRLDAVQGGSGAVSEANTPGGFMLAATSGSRVFFTFNRLLTADASTGEDDLYECEMIEVAGKLTCKLTDLTVSENAGESGGPLGVLGASEDGSYVYFTAKGVLARNAPIVVGGQNVYVHHDGTTSFIGVASPETTAQVSPNGHYLAFTSEQDLTGYDSRDANSGKLDKEVYLYDAESGRVVCASCNPTGARPVGPATLPGYIISRGEESRYTSHALSDGGRLFFGSPEALVPQDANGQPDVYEYEQAGVGDCSASSSTFSEASGGCVGLISSGTSDQASAFLDASASGEDVFFYTDGRLVSQDFDAAFDVYDAHVCSAAAPCSTSAAVPPACTTADSCRAAPALQPAVFGAPASATFSGSGNLTSSAPKPASPKKAKAKPKRRARKHTKHRKHRRVTNLWSRRACPRGRGAKGEAE